MSRLRTPIATALLAAALLLSVGCDTDGPSFPDGETIVFEATLSPEDETIRHLFALTHNGTVRLVLNEISSINPETGEPITNPILVVALGRPVADDCESRLTRSLQQGSSFPVFLEVGEFCLETGRPFGVPMARPITYRLTLEKAFS